MNFYDVQSFLLLWVTTDRINLSYVIRSLNKNKQSISLHSNQSSTQIELCESHWCQLAPWRHPTCCCCCCCCWGLSECCNIKQYFVGIICCLFALFRIILSTANTTDVTWHSACFVMYFFSNVSIILSFGNLFIYLFIWHSWHIQEQLKIASANDMTWTTMPTNQQIHWFAKDCCQ